MNGVQIRNELLEEYRKIIEEKKWKITLAIIQIGEDAASCLYVRNKIKYAEKVGITTRVFSLDEQVREEEVIHLIEQLNQDSEITGILLQSPTPRSIDFRRCSRAISSFKDVDGLTEENLFALRDHREKILPCTVAGILKLLEYYQIPLEGKHVVVAGRSNLVGRPLVDALINRDATVSLCHSKTRNLRELLALADIVVSAVGKPDFITKDMVKEGFIGIDVGVNVVDGMIVGDFSKDVSLKASYFTPVPGGVGPMTVAMVLYNLIQLKDSGSL